MGVERTQRGHAAMAESDPNRTLGAAFCCDARPAPQLDLLYLAVILASGEPYEASRVHHPARRCSGVAARGARAAAGERRPSGFWARARLPPRANGSPLLCSGCANSAGSRAAPSRSKFAGRRDASSVSRRSPPSLSGSRSMSLSRRDLRCSQRNRRPRSSRSCSRRWRTLLALASSPAWRGRAATSPACRSRRPNLRASASNSCARSSPASADWRSWPMPTIHRPCGSWTRSRPRPTRSASRPSR